MKAKINGVIYAELIMKLTEVEARALQAIACYGHENFLEFFYTNLGKASLEPHEEGLISLFKSLNDMEFQLSKIDNARKSFHK